MVVPQVNKQTSVHPIELNYKHQKGIKLSVKTEGDN